MKLICLECGSHHHVEVSDGGPDRHGACDICGEDRSLFLALGRTDRAVDELHNIELITRAKDVYIVEVKA